MFPDSSRMTQARPIDSYLGIWILRATAPFYLLAEPWLSFGQQHAQPQGRKPPYMPITALQTLYARHSLSQPPLRLEVLIGTKPNQWVYREGWWAGTLIKESHPIFWSLFLPCNADQCSSENSERDGIPDHLTCFSRNLYAGQEAS